MRTFETKVEELKYKVLKETASLYWKRELVNSFTDIPKMIVPGPEPTMRCCIYKERAIVSERVHMATGGNRRNPSVVEVIDIACDECPVGGYTVSDMCRGCIAHRCESACPMNAIHFDRDQKAYIDKSVCVECGRCHNVCPYGAIINYKRPCEVFCKTKAISSENGSRMAAIDEHKCISCGVCIYQCPFGAIVDKSYMLDVIDILRRAKPQNYETYAIVAPSVIYHLKDIPEGKIVSALRALGFSHVRSVSEGADEVLEKESREWEEKGFLISSCCPSFVNYVRLKFPDMVKHISSVPSPMQALGEKIRRENPEARIVFVGPCIGKKSEYLELSAADKGEERPVIDSILTFEELIALIDSKNIDTDSLPEAPFEGEYTEKGSAIASAGGLSAGIEALLAEKNPETSGKFVPARCSGLDECRQALVKASHGANQFNFIEGMACTGGCRM